MDIKAWLDKRSRDGQKKKKKKRIICSRSRKRKSRISRKIGTKYNRREQEHPLSQLSLTRDVPEVFSFLLNPEETIGFFNKLVNELAHNKKRKFKINSRHVKRVTVDALIYLLALMKNFGMSNKHNFEGNVPIDVDARKIYEESGFLDYMYLKINGEVKTSSENIRIITGKNTDSKIITTIIQFVEQKLNKTRKELGSLYQIFIEMMSNVYYHAYSEKSKVLSKSWYIYAEHVEDYIRIVFIDTGLGIANTVRTNGREKMAKILKIEKLIGKTDAELMKSAYEGEFRTQTEEKHRGNGLATICEKVKEPIYKNIKVISGKGQCNLLCNSIQTKDYKNSVMGTLYVFELK